MKEAPPNPNLVIPKSWPKYATFRGSRIELRVIAPTLSPADLADVEVDIPELGVTRPWKGSDYAIDSKGNICP